MNAARAFLLVTAGLLPTPALACTIIWTPLGAELDRRFPGEVPVLADASIAHDLWSDDHRRGTLTLNVRHCLRVPPRGVACPDRLTIAFDERSDGGDCSTSAIYEISAAEAPRLHFFLLGRQPDGTWTVRRADRHLWRR
jgi:hypothetical protein